MLSFALQLEEDIYRQHIASLLQHIAIADTSTKTSGQSNEPHISVLASVCFALQTLCRRFLASRISLPKKANAVKAGCRNCPTTTPHCRQSNHPRCRLSESSGRGLTIWAGRMIMPISNRDTRLSRDVGQACRSISAIPGGDRHGVR